MKSLVVVAALGAAACTGVPAATPATGELVARRADLTLARSLDYYLYLPDGYEARADWPLVVFLHGGGESGSDLAKVAAHGPPRLIAEGRDFPFVMIAPQNPHPDRMWDDEAVMALIGDALPTLRVDPDRVVVTGLSRGGMATWRLGMQHPDAFAGLVPIAGGGLPVYAFRLKDVPVWAFYGEADEVVSYDDARRVADRLAAAGGDVRVTAYPDVGHVETWQRAYADPALYDWITARRRRPTQGATDTDG